MMIERLEVKNFRSHRHSIVEFDRGINVMVGDNGAGKTSLLEAVNFALFRETPRRVKVSELITRGAEDEGMMVSLVFRANGRTYKVVRERGKVNADKLYADEALITGDERDSQTTREIEKTVRMDSKLFSSAVYIKQGDIDALMAMDPAKRKELVGRLIGTEDLENAWNEMPKLIAEYERRIVADIPKEIEEVDGLLKECAERIATCASELEKIHGEMAEREASLSELKSRQGTLRGLFDLRVIGERLAREIASAKDALQGRAARAREEFDRASSVLGIRASSYEDLDKAYRERKEKLQAARDVLGEKTRRTIEILEGAKAMGARVNKSISELRKAEDKCPVCGARLDDEHKQKIFEDYTDELSALRKEVEKLEAELEGCEKEAEKFDEEARSLEEGADLKGIRALLEIEAELVDALEKREAELAEVERSMEARLREYGLVEFVGMPRERVFASLDGEARSLDENLEELSKAISDLLERRGRLAGERNALERNAEELRKRLLELEAKESENEKLLAFVSFLNALRVLFDKDHLQKELRMRHKPRIEGYSREYLERFNLPYTDMALTEDYNISVFDSNGERTADMLSGGERIAAALALRFGIASDLLESAGAMELMILDEPTVHLDQQRRQELVELVKRLSSLPQTIVVTHDREFEQAADRLITVRRSDGISNVEYS